MTKALLHTGLFVLISTLSNAQTAKPRVFLGIDLFRSFPTYFQRGYTVESSVIYHSPKGWMFDLAAGFTNIQHSKIYANMSYRNEGNYWRFAVRKEIGANFDLGLGIGRSSFTEFGEVIFSDRVFGDYTLKLNQRNTLYFLEPTLSYKINLGPRVCLIPQYRMPVVLSNYNEEAFPVYAAPGIGDMQFLGSGDGRRSSPSTIAISFRLTYKITKD